MVQHKGDFEGSGRGGAATGFKMTAGMIPKKAGLSGNYVCSCSKEPVQVKSALIHDGDEDNLRLPLDQVTIK